MQKDALGLIETKGLTAAVDAGDSMVKAANVSIIGYRSVGSGLTTVIVEGDVGAVQASLEAGVAAAKNTGQVLSSLILPRPDQAVVDSLNDFAGKELFQPIKQPRKTAQNMPTASALTDTTADSDSKKKNTKS